MSMFIVLFSAFAFSMERWELVNWGPWFWGTVIAVNTANIGLRVLERWFPRTWMAFRRELGMYRNVTTRWILENALKTPQRKKG